MKKKLRVPKKIVLILVSVLVVLALIEGAARVLLGSGYPMNLPDPVTVRLRILFHHFFPKMLKRSPDPAVCYEPIPGGRVTLLDQHYSINRHGLRGPEIAAAKPPGTVRIAVCGDSFVFGWGADDRLTIPALMEDTLRRTGRGAARYEVLNCGVPGYNTGQMKELLLRKAFPLDPDVLVLVVSANDIEARYMHFDDLFKGFYTDFLPLPYGWKPFFWRVSVAYRYVVQRHKDWMRNSGRSGAMGEGDLAFFEEQVRATEGEARSRGIDFLAVVLPILEDFNQYPYARQHEDMGRVLAGMDHIDLLERMKGWDVRDLWFRPEDHHLNTAANRAVARMVLQCLEERGWVDLAEGALPEDPLAEPRYRPGDLVVADMDADPGERGGFPGALFRVDPTSGEVTVVSDDPAFREPVDLCFDAAGNLLVLDAQADPAGLGSRGAVFRVDRFTGKAETLVTSERFRLPNALIRDGADRIYIAEKEHDPEGLGRDTGALLVFEPDRGTVEILASGADFVAPGALAFAPEGMLYFMDADANPEGHLDPRGRPATPGVLFEVDPSTGAYRPLVVFRNTVSPVGMVPLEDGRLFVIDTNADPAGTGGFPGGLLLVDPGTGGYEFLPGTEGLLDPARGDLGLDGFIYFTDANADPMGLGPDPAGKGVEGTGPGAVMRYDLEKRSLSVVASDHRFVNPISLKVPK